MKTIKSYNKWAVKITAFFICIVILSAMLMPFVVSAVNYISISWTKSSNRELYISTYYINDNGNISSGGISYSTGLTSGVFNYIPIGPNDYFLAYGQQYSSFSGSYTYYRCLVNGLEGGTSSSNPTIVQGPLTLTITNSSSSFISSAQRYWKVLSGYTLTFDSQGGSTISPLTGVTDVILGDSTGYYPEYVPERAGYAFLGWSLTPGGTYVREVHLTEDTTLYANWERYSGILMIEYAYHQIPLYRTPDLAITAPGIVENYTFLDFYYPDTASLPHWYNEWIVTDTFTGGNNYKKIIQAEHIDDYYRFYVQTYDFDITISPYIYPVYTLTVNISENMDQYVSFDDGDTFTYDTHEGLTLNYDTYWPYWDVYLMLYDLDDHEDYYYGSGVFSNWGDLNTNDPNNVYYSYEFYTDFGADTNLNFTMFRSDIDIDPTTDIVSYEVNPLTSEVTVVWTVSQTDLLDISWDELRSEMPDALNGILGGFYGLPMLSTIAIFCFIAGFAVWFVRRGD